MTVTCGDVGKDKVGKRHEEVTCVVQRKWSRGVEGEGERATKEQDGAKRIKHVVHNKGVI